MPSRFFKIVKLRKKNLAQLNNSGFGPRDEMPESTAVCFGCGVSSSRGQLAKDCENMQRARGPESKARRNKRLCLKPQAGTKDFLGAGLLTAPDFWNLLWMIKLVLKHFWRQKHP